MVGATPKVTSSASESISLPSGPDTFNLRAIMPSKKSKTAPKSIKKKAGVNLLCAAKMTEMQPQIKLQLVIILGKIDRKVMIKLKKILLQLRQKNTDCKDQKIADPPRNHLKIRLLHPDQSTPH